MELDISRYVCPPGWEWVDEWTPVVQDSDNDGWRYNFLATILSFIVLGTSWSYNLTDTPNRLPMVTQIIMRKRKLLTLYARADFGATESTLENPRWPPASIDSFT